MMISNLVSLIKNNADEAIDASANPHNRFRYQANRTFIIGRVKKIFPKILAGITDISAVDSIYTDALKKKSQLQPGGKVKRQRFERRRRHFNNCKVTV